MDFTGSRKVKRLASELRLTSSDVLQLIADLKIQPWILLQCRYWVSPIDPSRFYDERRCQLPASVVQLAIDSERPRVVYRGPAKTEDGETWKLELGMDPNRLNSNFEPASLILHPEDCTKLREAAQAPVAAAVEPAPDEWDKLQIKYYMAALHYVGSLEKGAHRDAVFHDRQKTGGHFNVSALAQAISDDAMRYFGREIGKKTLQGFYSKFVNYFSGEAN